MIEYFFEIIVKEFKTQIIIEADGFKGKEKELKKIANNINIGEKKKLLLVLLKFIELDEFKKQLDSSTEYFFKNLIKNPVKFADAKPVEEKNFHETLANRIYYIRNALIHRKEMHKKKYLPSKNEHREELKLEIPIIKAIATQIILEYSISSK